MRTHRKGIQGKVDRINMLLDRGLHPHYKDENGDWKNSPGTFFYESSSGWHHLRQMDLNGGSGITGFHLTAKTMRGLADQLDALITGIFLKDMTL